MNSEHWQKVKGLFDAVVELSPIERKRFLDKSCGTDKELRREVKKLLGSYDDSESFIEQPAAAEIANFIIESKNLEAGKSFGHYEIIKQIGAGGMGEVYLAEDTKLDRKVAVKILSEKFAKHESNLQRFIQEAKAASALNHPNILVIHEIGESENSNYIVSEFIEGETLREVIQKSPMKLSEILDIAVQIANALTAAHAAHIVHRDIKPENIIVRPDGYVKILDFGLAKLVEQKSFIGLEDKTAKQNETAKGIILGTVNYMSPEQAKGEKVDGRTDIFSFGVLLYELIAGRTPFASSSMSETFANLINAEPPPLARFSEDVPDELQRIISKTLRKNKDERYQTMKGLLGDLKSLHRRLEFESELKKNSRSEKKTEEKTQIFETKTSREIPKLPPNNLSENIFPIVGREKEISEIENVLRQTNARLLTMTGIGGTGKTTLARAVAGELLDEFADGVFFIGLATITDPALVVSSIGQPLGVKEAGGKPLLEILKDYLRGKQILLVLDNFEQVTDAAPTIAELLSAANRLKILITSRTLLHLSAEREFVVPPLSLPSDISQVSFDDLSNYEAVKLFDQCARNIKPNFALTEENANDVAEICARLDGLPLAIELAAARIKILSPQAILAKLENRLKLLTGGASDLPARQQTMRGAIEWSYDILTADEKKLFRRLSVFAGGFTFEAAEAVCGNDELSTDRIEVLDLITSLVDKSLIVQKEQPNDEFRFRMLEVVREYAAEILEASDESEATRKNHAAFFLQLAETAQPHFFDEQGAKWLDRLEEEYDNLRAALSWSAVSDAETTINLTVAVRTFWVLHNHLTEGRKWLEAALEQATDAPADIRFKLLYGFGQVATYQGDIETARRMYEESLAVSKEAGEKRQIALASRGLGTIAKLRGDFTTARKFINESLKISRELNDKHGIAVSLNNLGDLARIESDFRTARPLLEEALAISRELGNKEGICGCLNNLGASAFGEGNFAAASTHYAEAITTALDLGDKITVSYSLDGFAALALKRGKKEKAAQLEGAVEHLHQSIGFVVEPAERRFRDAYLSELKIKMDEVAFSKFYEQGRKMKLEEAVALGLEETGGETKTERTLPPRAENATEFLQATTGDVNNQTNEANNNSTGQIKSRKSLTVVALVTFLILTIGFGYYFLSVRNTTSNAAVKKSLAVLPFINAGKDENVEYLSDGIRESIINNLSQLSGLRVMSSNSAFRFKGNQTDTKNIALQLGVETLITGDIKQLGDKLIINVRLINGADDSQIWGNQYIKSSADILAAQNEIAQAVAQNLRVRLTGTDQQQLAKRPTENVEAYQLYLRGRFHVFKLTPQEINKGISYFEQAIALDPNYALAYAGISDAYRSLAVGTELTPKENLLKSKAAAEKAIEIDDTLSETYASLGATNIWLWNWSEVEKSHKRALELNPNSANAHLFYAHYLSNMGRHAEALNEIKLAREIEPLFPFIGALEGQFLNHAGRTDEALDRLQKTLEIAPNFWMPHLFASSVYIEKGMYDEAIAEAHKAAELSPAQTASIAFEGYALAKSGKQDEARNLLDKLLKLSTERFIPPDHIAMIYNGLGETDKALEWLEKGYEQHDPKMAFLKVEPKWNNLRNEPRFIELMKKMNFD